MPNEVGFALLEVAEVGFPLLCSRPRRRLSTFGAMERPGQRTHTAVRGERCASRAERMVWVSRTGWTICRHSGRAAARPIQRRPAADDL